MSKVLTVMLAGGAGERLYPLTRDIAKPAVPFGGNYRIIDITLSNSINSGLRKIYILTQYKALTLNRHIRQAWNIVSPELGEFIEVLPPTKRVSEHWYRGTADAVYQNAQSIEAEDLPYTLILSADHVYKMNYQYMLDWHMLHEADVTVATTQVVPEDACRFGIVEIDSNFFITGFEEKPKHGSPARSRFNPSMCSASMGVYVFSTKVLLEALLQAHEDTNTSHDFGKDILPRLVDRGGKVLAYDFVDENKKEIRYWRDIGTLDAYYEANMDLVSVTPVFNLYDEEWPLRTYLPQYPPAKFVFAEEGRRMGVSINSMICAGCIISGGRVVNTVLSPGVRVNSYSEVESSILFHNVNVGRHSRLRRSIIDSGVVLPEGTEIGFDVERDRKQGHVVTESGIVIVHRESPGVTVDEQYAGLHYSPISSVNGPG
jgi:glucose-1-phosphate adenylyltransferase